MLPDSLKFPSERVVELEAELKQVRETYEQYVSSTKGIEEELDKELADMRKKLASSTAANDLLGKQLEQMQPLVEELEKSLETSKAKLKEESKLRREAEVALEARDESTDVAAIRKENESLREELKKYSKGNKKPVRTGVDDSSSYKEILDELEGVTEQLIDTQQNLWVAEDKLRESQNRVKTLDEVLTQLENEARPNTQKSLLDLTENETFDSVTVKSVDHAQELKRVHKQLQEARKELRLSEKQAKHAQKQARLAHDIAKNTDSRGSKSFGSMLENDSRDLEELQEELERCQDELDECKDENATLLEEISCLREVLQGQTDQDRVEAQNKANQRSKELNVLREKLKVIVKQNAVLQEKVNRSEGEAPSSRDDEVLHLKKEIVKLQSRLERAGDEKMSNMNDSEIEWHLRLEKLRTELDQEKEEDLERMRDEMMEERDVTVNALEDRMEQLLDENYGLEIKVENLKSAIQQSRKEQSKLTDQAQTAAENLSAARDEILALKKKTGILSTDLEHVKRIHAKADSEAKQARDQYADVCAELEVARQVLDEAGLQGETIAREDETELKRQIHSLSKSLEQTRQDYAELENDFLDSQHRFCDSQEDAHRKTSDEIHYLTGKISEMEAALEATRADYSEVLVKLENARKESLQSLKKGEKLGRESAIRAFQTQKSTTLQGPGVSDDDSGVRDLQQQVGELMAQLEKVKEELYACKAELKTSSEENLKLKQELSETKESENETIVQVPEKSNYDDAPIDSRVKKEAEYVVENQGLEVVRAPSMERNLLNPLSWFTKDPPSKHAEVGTDSEELHSQLRRLARENSSLKEKISSMVSSGRLGASKLESVHTTEIKQVIRELEEALRANEKTSDELERVSQKLAKSEKKLAATQKALDESDEENESLRSEVRELKDAVSDLLQNLEDAKIELATSQSSDEPIEDAKDEFHELRDQLTALAEEKASVQHQLDDCKIALSVSEYARERNKEELKVGEANLLASSDEVFRLRDELYSMSQSLSDVKQAYDDVVSALKQARSPGDDDDRKAVSKLSKQLKQLSDEKMTLQSTVVELEAALKLAQLEIGNKAKQFDFICDKLSSKEEETKILTDEITRLVTDLQASKAEYNLVVEELETVCELFEEARSEAERDGKETAFREIQIEMKNSRERDREAMREEAKRIFQDSGALQRKLTEVEHALAKARSGEEISSMRREIKILKDALQGSDEEIKRLKEKEMSLSLALKETKNDLSQTKDELHLLSQSIDDSRKAAERSARQSAAEVFRSMDNSEDLLEVREKLKILLKNTDEVTMGADSADPDGGHMAEGVRLKMELLDMSMSLEKIMKENAIIEEELEHMRYATEQARKEGEKEGAMKATNQLRQEMKEHREREMLDFKEKFNELVEENSSLSQKLRDAEVKLALAIDTKEQSTGDVARLQKDLESAKAETAKFQQEVFSLSSELRAVHKDNERTDMDKEITLVSSTESETKVKELQAKLNALTLENTKLQNKLRNVENDLGNMRSAEERGKREMASLLASLQVSKATIEDFEDQVSSLSSEVGDIKSTKEVLTAEKAAIEKKLKMAEAALEQARATTLGDVTDLNKALKASKDENSTLKSLTAQLKQTLEESTKELDRLREQFDRVCSNVAARDENEANALRTQLKKLVEEKAALQKQVDESKINLSLQKYTRDRSTKENRPNAMEKGEGESKDGSEDKPPAIEPREDLADPTTSASDRDAELRLLQDQFKKLSQKSESLGKKVEEAENVVTDMHTRQEMTREQTESRKKQAQDLQVQVEKALRESERRDQEMSDLARAMGSRVSMAEENVNQLEREISSVKGKIELTEAGLFVFRERPPSNQAATATTANEQRDSGNTDEDSSIHSAELLAQSESRDDEKPASRDAPPAIQPSLSKETNLTSRALEAIARSRKKNNLRKLDLEVAQSNIFGGPRNHFAETGKEEVPTRD